jgi:hypothetical protein
MVMRRRARFHRVFIVVGGAAAAAVPALAVAQPTCGPGQLAVDAAGHCSPGQTWDAASGQCANVVPAASASAPAPPLAPSPPPPLGPPLSTPPVTNVVVSPAFNGDPTAPVAVTFAPEQPGDQETLVIQPIIGPSVTCAVPCVVDLVPGYVAITGKGQRDFATALNVPPLLPLTVQVNHLSSSVPGLVAGGLLLTIGVGATASAIYFIASSASSCNTAPQTAAQAQAEDSCVSANDTRIILGSLLIPVGITSALFGAIVLAGATRRGDHPITLMDPGTISSRPLTGSAFAPRFAGVEPVAVQGGALLRGGFVF